MDIYKEIDFAEKKKENLKTCPYYNTAALVKLGMKKEMWNRKFVSFIFIQQSISARSIGKVISVN